MKVVALLLLLTCLQANASLMKRQPYSQEEVLKQETKDYIHKVITTSHIAGACTQLMRFSEFQKHAKISGGNEFIVKFARSEAKRMKVLLEEYLQQCRQWNDLFTIMSKDVGYDGNKL